MNEKMIDEVLTAVDKDFIISVLENEISNESDDEWYVRKINDLIQKIRLL